MRAEIAELAAWRRAYEAEREAEARRAEVRAALAGLPEAVQAGYARMRVDGMDGAAWGAQMEAVRREAAEIRQALAGQGLNFGPPRGAGPTAPGAASAEELAAALERAGLGGAAGRTVQKQ